MRFPDALQPTAKLDFHLADSRIIPVPKVSASFQPWLGQPVGDDYGGKTVLNYEGEPLFAELVILRHFQSAGWRGVWIDTYRRRIRNGMTEDALLPEDQRALLDRIADRAGTSNGCFDVFAWKDGTVAFAESKRAGRDRIRASQVHWLAAALNVGVPLESLLVIEWSLADHSASTGAKHDVPTNQGCTSSGRRKDFEDFLAAVPHGPVPETDRLPGQSEPSA